MSAVNKQSFDAHWEGDSVWGELIGVDNVTRAIFGLIRRVMHFWASPTLPFPPIFGICRLSD
jgi:hypothetical protein